MSVLEDMLDVSAWMQDLDAMQHQRVRQALIKRSVAAGGFVCRKGEPVNYWVGVIDGLVKISNVSLKGKAVTFAGVAPGGWFGEGSMLKDEPRRYDAVALHDSRIAYMPRATFQWLLDTSIAFNRFLLHRLNERLGQVIGTVECDRLLGPDARVARRLAQLFDPLLYPGLDMQLKISQGEIGYLTGLSRQRVNQALSRLERNGLLRVDFGSVTVISLDQLREFEE